jgi:transposase
MNKKYLVKLTDEERQSLQLLVSQGRAAARTITRAWVLLKADAGPGPGWSDEEIRATFAVGLATIYRVRQTFVEEGLAAVLSRRPKSRHRPRKLDGEQEAHLIALACSKPPPGRRRWTIRLLAGRLVELGHTEHVCPETVRQTLKKRTEAVVGEDVVHPTQGQRRVRVAYGRRSGDLQTPLRSALSPGVHGRSKQATGRRSAATAGDATRTGAAAGQRIRA